MVLHEHPEIVDRIWDWLMDIPKPQSPKSPEPRTSWERFIAFIEQPLFTASFGIIGSLVGVLFYSPVSIVCDVCALLALHRSKAVADKKRLTQLFWYVIAFIFITGILFELGHLVRNGVREYVRESPSQSAPAQPQKPNPNPKMQPRHDPSNQETLNPAPKPYVSTLKEEALKRFKSNTHDEIRFKLNELSQQMARDAYQWFQGLAQVGTEIPDEVASRKMTPEDEKTFRATQPDIRRKQINERFLSMTRKNAIEGCELRTYVWEKELLPNESRRFQSPEVDKICSSIKTSTYSSQDLKKIGESLGSIGSNF